MSGNLRHVASAGAGTCFGYDTRNRLASGNGAFYYHNPLGLLAIRPGLNLDYVATRPVSDTANGGIQRRYVYGRATTGPWSGTRASARATGAISTPTSAAASSR